MHSILNTERRTYLITFNQNNNAKFIYQTANQLVLLLETYTASKIVSIKEFNPITDNFKRVKKAELVRMVNSKYFYDTEENFHYLNNHNYFI